MKAIVACTRELGIGYKNKMPWHIPDELRLFKMLTTNTTVVMGRKTFESIGKKELPNRENIILTSSQGYDVENGVKCVHKESDVVDSDDTFIIGGSQIYELFLDQITEMYVSFVSGDYLTDTNLTFNPMEVFEDHEVYFKHDEFVTLKFTNNKNLKQSRV